jgi:hypothetical protein
MTRSLGGKGAFTRYDKGSADLPERVKRSQLHSGNHNPAGITHGAGAGSPDGDRIIKIPTRHARPSRHAKLVAAFAGWPFAV